MAVAPAYSGEHERAHHAQRQQLRKHLAIWPYPYGRGAGVGERDWLDNGVRSADASPGRTF